MKRSAKIQNLEAFVKCFEEFHPEKPVKPPLILFIRQFSNKQFKMYRPEKRKNDCLKVDYYSVKTNLKFLNRLESLQPTPQLSLHFR